MLVDAVSDAHMRKESKLSFHRQLWGACDDFGADGRNMTRRTVVHPEVVVHARYSRKMEEEEMGMGDNSPCVF